MPGTGPDRPRTRQRCLPCHHRSSLRESFLLSPPFLPSPSSVSSSSAMSEIELRWRKRRGRGSLRTMEGRVPTEKCKFMGNGLRENALVAKGSEEAEFMQFLTHKFTLLSTGRTNQVKSNSALPKTEAATKSAGNSTMYRIYTARSTVAVLLLYLLWPKKVHIIDLRLEHLVSALLWHS